MKLIIIAVIASLHLLVGGCGTEIGNGEEQKGRESDKSGSGEPLNQPNESFEAPTGSPINSDTVGSTPVLEAFTNYCSGPGAELTTTPVTLKSKTLKLVAQQFSAILTYDSGYQQSVTGTKNENFNVGLATYTCGSFSQSATESISGVDGTFTKKTQTLTSPGGDLLTVVWYVDEDNAALVKVEITDVYSTVSLTNVDY